MNNPAGERISIPDPVARDCVSLPRDMFPDPLPRLGAWRVAGDSMSGDCIRDGDYVVADFDREPRDGDIAAVYVKDLENPETGELEGGRLLKRVRMPAPGVLVLESSNPAYPPVVAGPGHAAVEAVIIGVFRDLDQGE